MRTAALLLSAILLYGCGGDSSPTAPPSTPPTPKPARDQFVKVIGSHLALEDGTPFYVQGAVYWDSMYLHYPTVTYPETGTIEVARPYWIHQDFDEDAIEREMVYLRDIMHLNTLKIATPAWQIWRLWMPIGTSDWFQPDGAISPFYLDRLQRIIAIARRNDLRVIIQLFSILSLDWECPTHTGGWEFLPYPLAPHQACRIAPPGSLLDLKYQVYLRSLIEPLKEDRTVIMYDVSNEVLLNWPLNGLGNTGNDWYQERMLSFVTRRAREIRAIDHRHLLTTGEVLNYFTDYPEWWAYPSPEFGLVDDVDNLNGGRPFTLESILDVLAPHVYNFNMPSEQYEEAIAAMRARTVKPIILGEFGYAGVVTGAPQVPTVQRSTVSQRLLLPVTQRSRVSALKRLVTMQGSLTEGGVLFNPYGAVPTPPAESYHVITIPDGRQFVEISGTPARRIWGLDFTFTMFTHDVTSPLGVRPLPEIVDLFPPL